MRGEGREGKERYVGRRGEVYRGEEMCREERKGNENIDDEIRD